MNKDVLAKLNPEVLADVILNMGHIIRTLDEDNEYLDYWTQDGEYIISLPYVNNSGENIKENSPHFHHWSDGTYYSHSHAGGITPHGHHGSKYGAPPKGL
jgi:hypothetical protein